ncbi:glycerol-3-phosphate dehydrogenase [NAD(+)]-like [Papaver somniferum]|uniref:glycerol-3-phosphate dehydrogenase [NAD(+)]-like n=1 Tax=Papaver somniferum TaxID=3469 RepID=UPI000E6F54CB|nr:glycerol-3-phosphate dehydrogenase [NAD(+)]-like [Papaver somniferum]
MEVSMVLKIIQEEGPSYGLQLNVSKTEIIWPSYDPRRDVDNVFHANIGKPVGGIKLLGGPENIKYLPGIKLGHNVVADPDLEHAVEDANMLVFVTPHQFIEGICKRLVGKIKGDVEAISLIKGMEVKPGGPCMISSLINKQLGVNCCVLMGANIGDEVILQNGLYLLRRVGCQHLVLFTQIAMEKFSEATIGYREDKEVAQRWVQIFGTPYFRVSAVRDIEGVELCGTLKNVVAIAAGFVDGSEMGNNAKAAIMRIGLNEMKAFSKLMFPSVCDNTFLESCGIADLITTCLGGRKRKVADAFARSSGKRLSYFLRDSIRNGLLLKGVKTAGEVYEVLCQRGWQQSFPLSRTVHVICTGHLPPSAITQQRLDEN